MASQSALGTGVDIYIVYRFVKALSTPFNQTPAFKLGLIDDEGKRLKKAETTDEKRAMTYFDRLIFNMKRLLAKVGLNSKVATLAAALLLLRENTNEYTEEQILEKLNENIDYLNENSKKNFKTLEEEIANVTGPAVAGTGDDAATWVKHPYRVGPKGERKHKGRYINGVAYLKKIAKEAAKKQDS